MKVNLELLNKLVKELNAQNDLADKIPTEDPALAHDYVSDISKCMGLVTTIALEASALSHDFLAAIKHTSDKSIAKNLAGTVDDTFGFGDLFKKTN